MLEAAATALLILAAILPGARAADTSERTITVGGVERSYLVSRPATSGPRPTVVVLHGIALSAKEARRDMGFEPLVDREELMAVYPDAIARRWNDGRKTPPRVWRGQVPDDVGFVRAVIAELVKEGLADPARIYVTGASNGGMMTFRLVCEAPDLLAAASPIVATMPVDLITLCVPARPLPVLVMNGTADPLVPYGGGGRPGYHRERGQVYSTEDTIAWLRRFNGCTGAPARESLPDLDPRDGSNVKVERWTSCSSRAAVVLYRVEGGGHRVPTRDPERTRIVDRMLGKENHDFEAAEAIWAFFKDRHI